MTDATITLRSVLRGNARAAPASYLAAALLFFGMFALFLSLADRLLQDPDTHWHVAIGEEIWRSSAFPQSDTRSHTFAGAPWIAKEWLSQVILYAAHALAGWWGLAVFTALTAAGSFAGLFAWLLRRVHPTAALMLAGLALTLAAGQILARPHLFFFPILMAWTAGLIGAAEQGRAPSWWLVALMALWANLHASFPIGLLIAGFVALEAIAASPARERMGTIKRWSLFAAASLAAMGATPYGYEPLVIGLRLIGDGEAMRYISEWQPLGFGASAALPLAVAGATIVVLAAEPRRNLFRLLLVGFIAYMMMRHARFTGMFGIVAAIVSATPLTRMLTAAKCAASAPPYGRPTRMALVLLAAVCALLAAFARPAPSARITPDVALEAARAAGLSGPVFNEYDFGGYLIAQGIPTFIDGRSDQIFNGGFMNALNEAVAADGSALLSFIEKYGVTWSLVRSESPEARIFAAATDWREVHRDDVAAVYAKRSADPAP